MLEDDLYFYDDYEISPRTMVVYQEKTIVQSNLLGPDGEYIYYEQEYNPGFEIPEIQRVG